MEPDRAEITVLHVDDEPAFGELVATFLERIDDRISVVMATDPEKGRSRLGDHAIDCIVSDYDMPNQDGLAFLRSVREQHPDLPFILFTGKGNEEIASEAITAGVTDYIQKTGGTDQYTVLANRITNVVEASRTESQLRESRKRTSMFFEQSPLGVIEWTPEFELLRMNDRSSEILGYDSSELRGESWERLVPGDALEDVADVLDRLGEDEGGYHSVNENVTGDGETIVCEWHNRVITDESGDVVSVFSLFQEVTERERYQRRLNTLHETTQDLMRAETREDVAEIVSDAAREVLDLPINSVYLYSEVDRVLAPVTSTPKADELFGDLPLFEPGDSLAWEVFESGEPRTYDDVREADTLHNPGTQMRSEIVVPLGDHGVFIAGSTSADEFSSQRTALAKILAANMEAAIDRTGQYERLRSRERKIQNLQRRTQDLIRASSREDVVHIALEAAEQTLDLPLSGVHFVDESGQALEPVAVTDELRDHLGTAPTYTRDGGSRDVDSIVWDAFESGGAVVLDDIDADERVDTDETPSRSGIIHPLGTHGVFITSSNEPNAFDDTDVALSEILSAIVTAALDRAEREDFLRGRTDTLESQNEQLEEFTSIVSHDLRNPLNVAQLRLELARESTDEGDNEHFEAIDSAHQRMETLIENHLKLARHGERVDQLEPVDLRGVATDCWTTVETGSAELVMADDARTHADPDRLAQVFENLFRNSVEHGSINSRAESDGGVGNGEHITITVGTLPDGTGFYVEDDGEGIPPDRREDVFDPGHSSIDGGTGFGLSIVEKIVEAHGWDVRVTDGSDGGARFEITGVDVQSQS